VRLRSADPLTIKEDALYVADSHYPHHGEDFLKLLKKLESKEIKTPQLFLMGDNFDLLFGYNDYIQTFSAEAIELLKRLSQKMEIHYFEGNHDFCLKALFPRIHVYIREEQPVFFTLGEKRVGISHGDRYATGFGYDFYCRIMRSKITLTLLKPFEKAIIDDRMRKLSKKSICHSFTGFEKRVHEIMQHYGEADLVIEGHYHQAKVLGSYISLPSLACQKQVAVVKGGEIVFVSPQELEMDLSD